MKPIEDSIVAVIDSWTFAPLAAMFGEKAKQTYYHTPFYQEYLCIERCIIGDGMENFKRVDEYMDPKFFNSVDLWVCSDINFTGLQKYLRSLGKAVWGHMGAEDLELYRTYFIKTLKEIGLPVVPSVTIRGLTALAEHLKTVKDKWIKHNRYRANGETWHHIDWLHSEREIERQAFEFGPMKEHIVYVVQDAINGDDDSPVLEVGYDGWCIDGKFPGSSYSGWELKNKLYLGSQMDYAELPEQVQLVNEKFAPVLASYGYRGFFANEIRIKDGVAYFIDPTNRMAGQTQEHLLRTCTNLAEVINAGAHGELIKPEFEAPYAAEATIHYHPANESDFPGWKTFKMPKESEEWVKLYRCCFADGAYHFPPARLDELGVVIGNGNSVEEAVENLKDNFEPIKDEPVSIDLSGFADLLKQIEEAKDEGVPFTDQPLPDATIALEP